MLSTKLLKYYIYIKYKIECISNFGKIFVSSTLTELDNYDNLLEYTKWIYNANLN